MELETDQPLGICDIKRKLFVCSSNLGLLSLFFQDWKAAAGTRAIGGRTWTYSVGTRAATARTGASRTGAWRGTPRGNDEVSCLTFRRLSRREFINWKFANFTSGNNRYSSCAVNLFCFQTARAATAASSATTTTPTTAGQSDEETTWYERLLASAWSEAYGDNAGCEVSDGIAVNLSVVHGVFSMAPAWIGCVMMYVIADTTELDLSQVGLL